MIDVLAVALKGRVNLLLAEVEGVCPVYIPVFHEHYIRIATVVLHLEKTVIKAGVDHQQNIIQIQRVSNRMLI